MTKFAKRLTAALTTAAVLAASLVSTASAYTESSGSSKSNATSGTYTYSVYTMTHTVKYEAGPFFNTCSKHIDGYTTIDRYLPIGAATMIKTIKTHGILCDKISAKPLTVYNSTPLTDSSALNFESGSTYRVGVAANYYTGGLAVSEVSATATSPNNYVEKTATKQTNEPLTAYGNVRYQKGNSVIAGYYEVVNN